MIIPTSPDAARRLLQRTEDRLDALERGTATRGVASFDQRIQIGKGYIEFHDDGTVEITKANGVVVTL